MIYYDNQLLGLPGAEAHQSSGKRPPFSEKCTCFGVQTVRLLTPDPSGDVHFPLQLLAKLWLDQEHPALAGSPHGCCPAPPVHKHNATSTELVLILPAEQLPQTTRTEPLLGKEPQNRSFNPTHSGHEPTLAPGGLHPLHTATL